MTNPLYDALFAPLATRDRPFVTLRDGQVITGAAFHDMATRAAASMRAWGLQPGDRVAVQVAKSPEALALYAGAVMAGVVFLPLNTAYTGPEVDYFVADSGARLLICDPAADLRAPQVATLGADGQGTFWRDGPGGVAARRGDDLAALLYTSGTTGRSKGAMLSQDNLLSNAQVLVQEWRVTARDVLIHALPIFHTHGLFVATNTLALAGGSMIWLPKPDTDAILDAIPQATMLMGVPTFYTRLLADDRLSREKVSHFRLFISGSAPLLAETHRAFEDRTGQRILERYGMTETNMNTSNPYDGDRRAGTVGRALPGVELRVVDPETRAPRPTGEIGMIEVRGPNVFQGYWNMPDKTAEDLRADGFFVTGDLGMIDADGYVTISGRAKDLIIAGGFNIYPKEIEEALDAHPDIHESAVIGVPHPDLGEAVLGVIVPAPGATPDPQAILQALGDGLARFKLPRALEIVPDLPRNTMGKVQKNLLRAQFKDRFTA
jgi:malonyl-CoA/methylmalonyl-CoA synthetase